MKLGVIGSGNIVREFLPRFKQVNIAICALLSTPRSLEAAKKMGEEYDIKTVTSSFEEFVNSDIDTVYVGVPNYMHYSYCKDCMELGLHVICEKPLCSNYREAKALAELAEEKGVFLFEAITTIHHPNYHKIREWLPRIGKIRIVQSQYTQYSSRYDAFKAGEVLPAFDPEKSGGAIMDIGLYCLYFIIGLFGKPESYSYHPNIERGVDTSGIMIMDYPDFEAFMICAKDTKGTTTSLIQGDKGCIRMVWPPNVMGEVTLELNDGTVESFNELTPLERMIPELEAFKKAIEEKDYAFRDECMKEALDVAMVQSEARIKAGVIFAADK